MALNLFEENEEELKQDKGSDYDIVVKRSDFNVKIQPPANMRICDFAQVAQEVLDEVHKAAREVLVDALQEKFPEYQVIDKGDYEDWWE